jgi:hypothetical protein
LAGGDADVQGIGNFQATLQCESRLPVATSVAACDSTAAKQRSVCESPGADSSGFISPHPSAGCFCRNFQNFFLRPNPEFQMRRLCLPRKAQGLSRGQHRAGKRRSWIKETAISQAYLKFRSEAEKVAAAAADARARAPACGRIGRSVHERDGAPHTFL